MLTSRSTATASVSALFALLTACSGTGQNDDSLRDAAARAGVSIGSAAHDEFISGDADPDYPEVLAREFDSVTPYTAMKWGEIHPEPDRYEFSGADAIVDHAIANEMRVRGHTLIWGSAADPPNPGYVDRASSPQELRALMGEHIGRVMMRYRGQVDRWDVVNEPLSFTGEDGETDGLRNHVFLEQLGPGYIAEALELAHAADPDAQLFINDFFVLKPGPKQDRYFELAQELLEANVPLHGIGFQAHLYFLPGSPNDLDAPTEEEMTSTLERFSTLGVALELTELNVHTWRFGGDRDARLERQRQVYASAVRACTRVAACSSVTVWLFTDRYPTTVESTFERDGEPLLFDEEYAAKPAYDGVLDALRQAAAPTQL